MTFRGIPVGNFHATGAYVYVYFISLILFNFLQKYLQILVNFSDTVHIKFMNQTMIGKK